MILISDLDRTLIYSEKFVNDMDAVVKIENYKDTYYSYIHKSTLDNLKILNDDNRFIPITTRTKEQYDRISWGIKPKLAVVANGGQIYCDNKLDMEYHSLLNEKIKQESESLGNVDKYYRSLLPYEDIYYKKLDGLFLYVSSSDTKVHEVIRANVNNFEKMGWEVYFNGRKIYAIPKAMKKENAIRYIKQKYYRDTSMVSAGDSCMDIGMAKETDVFIKPIHGEIESEIVTLITKNHGVEAGIEISSYPL